jgi:DNA-binding GntR family transcriptional regulator
MNRGTITQTISDSLTYDTLHDTEDNLWSVLLMTGYLTKADPNAQGETVALRIPNQEVLSIFQDTVVRYFTDTVDRNEQNAMMNALWAGDEAAASEAISDLLWRTISYMDYHENYYHAFLTGVFVGLGYEVESNPERGLGRPDILLKDDDHRRALLIEAKRSAAEAQMEQDCDAALAQIEEKQYAEGLYGYRTILRYGVAFYRKSAMVKKG